MRLLCRLRSRPVVGSSLELGLVVTVAVVEVLSGFWVVGTEPGFRVFYSFHAETFHQSFTWEVAVLFEVFLTNSSAEDKVSVP